MVDEFESYIQETTSIYFNNIIRRNVSPKTVDELDSSVLDEFNRQLGIAFTDEAEEVTRRVRYLVPYILQNIDWDEYGIPLEAWQLRYYYQRNRFIKKTNIDDNRFLEHEPLQRSIEKLGLEPEPVFEFILFLKYYYGLRSDLRFSCVEQFDRLCKELEYNRDDSVAMDISIGGKHFKINNGAFLRRMFQAVDRRQFSSGAFVNDFTQGASRDKIRALDYYMVKTLLDYLPIDRTIRRNGRFVQAERNFGLSVLSLCGRLPDIDREGECGQENNATFDKLMRDFQGVPIPFAMELFL